MGSTVPRFPSQSTMLRHTARALSGATEEGEQEQLLKSQKPHRCSGHCHM